jgi:cytochrome c oxidase assembly protein subunit 15
LTPQPLAKGAEGEQVAEAMAIALSHAAPRAAPSDRPIAWWLLACCALVFLMVVVGGITRLTESGLSITEWQPVSGVLPPLDQAQWAAEFERYKAIPQYRAIHADMSLADFKAIYFWEYAHRLLGRLIGAAFLLPFLWFLIRRRIRAGLVPGLAAIFAAGALQGFIGWYMVESGLSDRIEVSQYRLALHLAAAVLIYAAMLWVALDLLRQKKSPSPRRGEGWGEGADAAPPHSALSADLSPLGRGSIKTLRAGASAVLGLAFVTLIAGAFVAGLRAGYIDNTFPLMEGGFVPPGYWHLEPWWRNFFEHPAAVQFDHRLLAETTLAAVAALWLGAWRVRLAPAQRWALHALLAMAAVQVGLGIATLLLVVPLPLAALHQAGAMGLVTAALVARHFLRAASRL